jgi:hypothetical protein
MAISDLLVQLVQLVLKALLVL